MTDRLLGTVRGGDAPRVRATWRVLLAVPLLWVFTGGVLAGNLQSAVEAIPSGSERFGGLAQSVLHAGFFTVVLVGWARFLDRRPLSDYGVSATPSWFGAMLLGTGAVVVGNALWYGFGSLVGWTTITTSLSASEGSFAVALLLGVVTLLLHAAVQQVVFFRVVLGSAAGGLRSRGLDARRAAVGGLVVAVPFFLAIHHLAPAVRVLDLVVVGTLYGLLYLHTWSLALGIGVHFGAFFAGTLFTPAAFAGDGASILVVGQSLPSAVQPLSYGFSKLFIAYLLLLAFLQWREGSVGIAVDPSKTDS